MARIFWTDRARTLLLALADRDQDEVRRQLRFVEQWPEMFPKLAGHPRWSEHRKIVIRQRYIVLYRVSTSEVTSDEQVYVTDIVPARSNY